ncbi:MULTISPECIES: hypothetical protein [Pseudomonas]|uniref:hypothetical protein n=1 Tax=Pseudomonas TaxID=286 RepID=UPI000FC43989|nr:MULTISPECIES: hypothetical protein [Pseudomonas]RUE17076.1 hypothetical protein IPC1222_25530 [Pseudomonas aeruginosa]CAH0134324.1 hypothetical protein SRABI111_00298 [Pseudomonas carnis]CAH0137307.1 hypothetical protein SRABI110_00442 [Pseudomonas carnis]CAH0159815.1 hypothetical protein SRABI64_00750 [Pseudomonas carnis]CAH0200300.1 hypothetical protein SRABI08_01876 [Pseudomonas carnis]
MKTLATLILMTVSTIAFAEPTFSNPTSFNIIPEAQAVQVTAEYEAMVDKVNTTLQANKSGYAYEEVKAVSSIVAKEVNSCKEGTFVEILDCKQNIADLAEQLTADVIKSHK